MRILLVEDDPVISDHLSVILKSEGFFVHAVRGEQDARAALSEIGTDLLLVDLALSDGSGFGVFHAAAERNLPVVFLTASDEEATVVQALDMGAADYISKPFRPRELISRLRGVLRRSGKAGGALCVGRLRVDPEKAQASISGKALSLSALEYRLLLRLAANPGRILTRDELLQELWDAGGDFVNDNTLSVYVKRLRDKLEHADESDVCIQTFRGQGYALGERHEA